MPFETPDSAAAECRKITRALERESGRRNDSPLRNEPMRHLFTSGNLLQICTLEKLLSSIPSMLKTTAAEAAQAQQQNPLTPQEGPSSHSLSTLHSSLSTLQSGDSQPPTAPRPDFLPRTPLSHHPFLWPDIIPTSQVTMLAGPPGIGKSFLMHDLAARISRGGFMPFSTQSQINRKHVIFFGGEDCLLYTVAPRLARMNADPANISFMFAAAKPNAKELSPVELERDMDHLRSEIFDKDAALVVIETIPAILRNRPDVIRAAFQWMERTAWEKNCAVVALTHTRPAHSQRNFHHLIGNPAYTTAARLIWRMEHTGDKGLRQLALEKCNIPIPDTQITLSLEDNGVNYLSSKQLAHVFDIHKRKRIGPDLQEAADFLLHELKNGPRPIASIRALALSSDIDKRTLRRARKHLGIKRLKPDESTQTESQPPNAAHWTQNWCWTLPNVQITNTNQEKTQLLGHMGAATPQYES